jgi:hypothetical protein
VPLLAVKRSPAGSGGIVTLDDVSFDADEGSGRG